MSWNSATRFSTSWRRAMLAPNKRVQRTRLRSPLTRHPLGGRSTVVATTALLALLLLARGDAEAKCGWIKYTIRATVRAAGQGPISDARLTFFVNDEKEPWLIEWSRSEPELYATDGDGRFSGVFKFDTNSGAFLGWFDRCNRKFKKLAVVVTKQGYCSQRVSLTPQQMTWTELEDESKVLGLPPIKLNACP